MVTWLLRVKIEGNEGNYRPRRETVFVKPRSSVWTIGIIRVWLIYITHLGWGLIKLWEEWSKVQELIYTRMRITW